MSRGREGKAREQGCEPGEEGLSGGSLGQQRQSVHVNANGRVRLDQPEQVIPSAEPRGTSHAFFCFLF